MISGSCVTPVWGFEWMHTSAETVEEYYRLFLQKIFNKDGFLRGLIDSSLYTHIDENLIMHYPYNSLDSITRQTVIARNKEMTNIKIFQVLPRNKGKDLQTLNKLTEDVELSVPGLQNRAFFMMLRPLLFDDILKDMSSLLMVNDDAKAGRHITYILSLFAAAYQSIYHLPSTQTRIEQTKVLLSHPTLKLYLTEQSDYLYNFEGLQFSWNAASYYPIRIYGDNDLSVQELTALITFVRSMVFYDILDEFRKLKQAGEPHALE